MKTFAVFLIMASAAFATTRAHAAETCSAQIERKGFVQKVQNYTNVEFNSAQEFSTRYGYEFELKEERVSPDTFIEYIKVSSFSHVTVDSTALTTLKCSQRFLRDDRDAVVGTQSVCKIGRRQTLTVSCSLYGQSAKFINLKFIQL